MDSISFDFAAEFYDATRGFPEGVAQMVADSLLSALEGAPDILEVGIGTGRITRPLLERSARLDAAAFSQVNSKHARIFGVDISQRMLSRLRAQLAPDPPQPSLVLGSGLALPFPAGTFDAVLMVHLIHLIKDWKIAIDESRRVLASRGALFIGYETGEADTPLSRLRKALHQFTLEYCPDYIQFGPASVEERTDWLAGTGAVQDVWDAAVWQETSQLSEVIDSYAQGIHSATWRIPSETRAEVIERLRRWTLAEFGSLDAKYDNKSRFVWERYHWEKE